MTLNTNGSGRERSAPSMSDSEQNLQQIMTLGQEASRALNNQSVGYAIASAARVLQEEWANTEPQEQKKREGLYQELQGLIRFANSLTGFVTRAQAENDRQHQMQTQQEQEYAQV